MRTTTSMLLTAAAFCATLSLPTASAFAQSHEEHSEARVVFLPDRPDAIARPPHLVMQPRVPTLHLTDFESAENPSDSKSSLLRPSSFQETSIEPVPALRLVPTGYSEVGIPLASPRLSPTSTLPSFKKPEAKQPAILDPMDHALGLSELEAAAVNHNPAVQTAIHEMQRIEGLLCQTGIRPNPTFGYSASQLADKSTDQHVFFLEQQFVRGEKLELNRAVLAQSLAVAQNQLSLVEQKVKTDVQKVFFQLAATQLKTQLIDEFLEVANRGVDVAQKRFEAEEGSRIEILQAQTLKSEVEMTRRQVQANALGAIGQLATLTGLTITSPEEVTIDLPKLPNTVDWESELQRIMAASPSLMFAQAKMCEAQAFLQRQQVQAIPNLTAQLGAGVDNGTRSGLINLQVSAPIPVRNRNQGNIAAARAAYQQASADVQRIENQLQAGLAQLTADYQSQQAVVENLQTNILPMIQETLNLSEQAYAAGELDFLQVAVIRKNLYEAQVRWIDSRLALSQTMAQVQGNLLEGAFDPTENVGVGDGLRDQSLGGE